MTTNYEKYFGTIEKTAHSLANTNGFINAFNKWADNDGALLCSLAPKRGARKAQKQSEVFEIWLQEEASDD